MHFESLRLTCTYETDLDTRSQAKRRGRRHAVGDVFCCCWCCCDLSHISPRSNPSRAPSTSIGKTKPREKAEDSADCRSLSRAPTP